MPLKNSSSFQLLGYLYLDVRRIARLTLTLCRMHIYKYALRDCENVRIPQPPGMSIRATIFTRPLVFIIYFKLYMLFMSQGYDGIDSSGLPRRDVTGQGSYGRENRDCAAQRDGIHRLEII